MSSTKKINLGSLNIICQVRSWVGWWLVGGETKHLSTDADSSTNAIGGWTKNTQKPIFFEKRKKSPKTQKLRNV